MASLSITADSKSGLFILQEVACKLCLIDFRKLWQEAMVFEAG